MKRLKIIILSIIGVIFIIIGILLLLSSVLLWINAKFDEYILYTYNIDPLDISMLNILLGVIILLIGTCVLYKRSLID